MRAATASNESAQALAPALEAKIRASFDAQGMLRTLGARLVSLADGGCEIELPYGEKVTQHHGYFHGGAIGMLADVAGGYAGYTKIGLDDGSLTAEYKINIFAPGVGEKLIARGRVVRAGRNLVVTTAEVFAVRDGIEKLIALMQQTLYVMAGMEAQTAKN